MTKPRISKEYLASLPEKLGLLREDSKRRAEMLSKEPPMSPDEFKRQAEQHQRQAELYRKIEE